MNYCITELLRAENHYVARWHLCEGDPATDAHTVSRRENLAFGASAIGSPPNATAIRAAVVARIARIQAATVSNQALNLQGTVSD
jgi:hypothetical protein